MYYTQQNRRAKLIKKSLIVASPQQLETRQKTSFGKLILGDEHSSPVSSKNH